MAWAPYRQLFPHMRVSLEVRQTGKEGWADSFPLDEPQPGAAGPKTGRRDRPQHTRPPFLVRPVEPRNRQKQAEVAGFLELKYFSFRSGIASS